MKPLLCFSLICHVSIAAAQLPTGPSIPSGEGLRGLRAVSVVANFSDSPIIKTLPDTLAEMFRRTVGLGVVRVPTDTAAHGALEFSYSSAQHPSGLLIAVMGLVVKRPARIAGAKEFSSVVVWGPALNLAIVGPRDDARAIAMKQIRTLTDQFIASYRSTQLPRIRKP